MSEGDRFVGLSFDELARAVAAERDDFDGPASGDFSIGSSVWPGLSKLIEECGEAQQVCGKLLGSAGQVAHWDGTNLAVRLAEELADVEAAILFVKQHNVLPSVGMRVAEKLALFNKWHRGDVA